MNERITIEFDGGSRGNPGPAGIGVVLRAEDGTDLLTLGRCIGRATNNVAEYRALITGLEEARKLGAKKVLVRGDSELIIRQMTGVYRVKNPDMKALYQEAQNLVRQFDDVKIEHNLRHKNELADKLVNLALDRKQDVLDADAPPTAANVQKTSAATLSAGTNVRADRPIGPNLAKGIVSGAVSSRPQANHNSPQVGDRFICPRCGLEVQTLSPSRLDSQALGPIRCACGTGMRHGPADRDK